MADKPNPWNEGPTHAEWCSAAVTAKLLGEERNAQGKPMPAKWTQQCALRIGDVRTKLRESWVGLELGEDHLIDWILAGLIARENVLLLGEPGVAKTEIAERTFALFGLETPRVDEERPASGRADDEDFREWWKRRATEERQRHKYFRYLLSRFTQPEELVGPIEIDQLRRGMLVHVNFGLMTSPGVRAAFLDEIFKASSSILNTLLTLVLEREYFNWGGMMRSDLLMLIGASNELPGGLATGNADTGSGGEDFNTLYAFLDRFPLRLQIPTASGSSEDARPEESNLAKATDKALERVGERFCTGSSFRPAKWNYGAPCINDALELGRAMLEQRAKVSDGLFDPRQLKRFDDAFWGVASALQKEGTGTRDGVVSWTISPRKLMALYKIALAHAVVRGENFAKGGGRVAGPDEKDLIVFQFIWDAPGKRDPLEERVRVAIKRFYK